MRLLVILLLIPSVAACTWTGNTWEQEGAFVIDDVTILVSDKSAAWDCSLGNPVDLDGDIIAWIDGDRLAFMDRHARTLSAFQQSTIEALSMAHGKAFVASKTYDGDGPVIRIEEVTPEGERRVALVERADHVVLGDNIAVLVHHEETGSKYAAVDLGSGNWPMPGRPGDDIDTHGRDLRLLAASSIGIVFRPEQTTTELLFYDLINETATIHEHERFHTDNVRLDGTTIVADHYDGRTWLDASRGDVTTTTRIAPLSAAHGGTVVEGYVNAPTDEGIRAPEPMQPTPSQAEGPAANGARDNDAPLPWFLGLAAMFLARRR